MRKTELIVSGEVIHPKTKASIVSHEHTNVEAYLDQQNQTSSIITQSSAMSQAGMGDDTDLSFCVEDGFYESATLYGKTLVNCIQGGSSQDVVLPYDFAEDQYVTIHETKESGALGVELKGQTLVNLSGHDRVKGISHAVYQDGIYKYVQDVNNFYDSLALSEDTMKMFSANKTYTFITDSKVLLSKVDGYDNPSRQNGIIIQFEDGTYQTPLTPMQNVGERVEHKIKFTIQNKPIKQVSIRAFTSSLPTKGTFNGEIYKMVLVEGDYTNQEIPYFEGMTSIKAPIVKTVGKNLVNLDNAVLNSNHQKVVTKIENGFNIKFAYNPNNYSSWDNAIRLRVDVKPNTNYVLSLTKVTRKDPYQGVTPLPLWVSGYTWVRQGGSHHDSLTEGNLTNGTPTVMKFNSRNYNYVTLDVCSTPSRPAQDGDFDIVDIQLEEDTQATIYEPHTSSSLTIPNEVVLRSLPNGVCDTFNTRTGEYVRRIACEVFTGASDEGWWQIGGTYENTAAFRIARNMARNVKDHEIPLDIACDKLKVVTPNQSWGGSNFDEEGVSRGTSKLQGLDVRISKSKLTAVTPEAFKQYLSQNPIIIQYELVTPIITKFQPQSTLKSWSATTHIYSEIPQNSLYPILSHSNPTYPVILKPSIKYSIVANSYSNNHTNSPINFNLGGATASITVGNRVTTVTTPSTLSNDLLTMSGKGNKLNNVMVIEGGVVGDEPYFEGICDVKSPVMKNAGKNLFNLPLMQKQSYVKEFSEHSITVNNGLRNISKLFELEHKANEQYTIVYDREAISGKGVSLFAFRYTDGTLSYAHPIAINTSLPNKTIDRIELTFSDAGVSKLSNICLVKDEVSNLTYEPYKSNTTTFNQKDGKIIVLRSLPNGVRDTLNVETGEYVQRIGETTFNGNENWTLLRDNENENIVFSCVGFNGYVNVSGGEPSILCDKIIPKKPWFSICSQTSSNGITLMDSRKGCRIGLVRSEGVTNAGEFRAWLSQNPITIQYELATPVVSTVDVQGFPYAYKDGHVQLSSGYNGQSLTPKLEYVIQANRAGVIQANQDRLVNHEKRFSALEAMVLHQLIQLEYRRAKGVFLSQTRQIFEGGIQMYHTKYDLLSEFIEKKLYRSLEEVLEMLDVYFMLGDLTDGEYDLLYETLLPTQMADEIPEESLDDEQVEI